MFTDPTQWKQLATVIFIMPFAVLWLGACLAALFGRE